MSVAVAIAIACLASIVLTIIAAAVCNTDWYLHRKALREIRYAAELRRAQRVVEIEDKL